MECLNTKKCFKINKEKITGDVIVVVEGEEYEFYLLKKIFIDILGFNFYNKKRDKKFDIIKKDETVVNSIYVINTYSSNIKSILNYDDLYKTIKESYHDDITNVPIYILWDRDNESNSKENVKKCLKQYGNAWGNDEDINGLLLISYPCIEEFAYSNFDNKIYKKKYKTSSSMKHAFNMSQYSNKKISSDSLITAVCNMNNSLKNINVLKYDPSDLSSVNLKVNTNQEELYKHEQCYNALSMISMMLLDLGLIIITDNE